jgi:septal ring factor EnvC (AmiA/AmiB activator)
MRQKWIFVCTIAICFSLVLTGCDKGAEQKAELESVKAELVSAKATSRKAENERDMLKEEMTAVTRTCDELRRQVTTLTDKNTLLQTQIDRLAGSDKNLTLKVTGLTASNNQLTEQLKEVAGLRDQLTKEVAGLKSSSKGLQAQVDELTDQRDAAVARAKEAQETIAELTAKLQAATGVEPEPQVQPMVAIDMPVSEEEAPKVEAVKPPTVHSFNTARVKIDKGQSATLSWHVSHADRISIEPDIGSVSALGSKNIKPSKTTTYTLTATNRGGETVETCTVEVR